MQVFMFMRRLRNGNRKSHLPRSRATLHTYPISLTRIPRLANRKAIGCRRLTEGFHSYHRSETELDPCPAAVGCPNIGTPPAHIQPAWSFSLVPLCRTGQLDSRTQSQRTDRPPTLNVRS